MEKNKVSDRAILQIYKVINSMPVDKEGRAVDRLNKAFRNTNIILGEQIYLTTEWNSEVPRGLLLYKKHST